MEQLRSRPLRERRLQAGKMLQRSILSESPSSYAAKGLSEHVNEASGWSDSGTAECPTDYRRQAGTPELLFFWRKKLNLKKTLIGLVIAACLAGSLFAQNKTSNSKETKMGKSLVVYFSLAGEQYKSHRLRAA